MNPIYKAHVGERLLVTDRLTQVSRDEIEVLEMSPSGKDAKVRNVIYGTTYWREVTDYTVLEVLPKLTESATPAKHPDTVLLEWLFGNTIIAGPDGHVIDCRDDTDAARKQGGAS